MSEYDTAAVHQKFQQKIDRNNHQHCDQHQTGVNLCTLCWGQTSGHATLLLCCEPRVYFLGPRPPNQCIGQPHNHQWAWGLSKMYTSDNVFMWTMLWIVYAQSHHRPCHLDSRIVRKFLQWSSHCYVYLAVAAGFQTELCFWVHSSSLVLYDSVIAVMFMCGPGDTLLHTDLVW